MSGRKDNEAKEPISLKKALELLILLCQSSQKKPITPGLESLLSRNPAIFAILLNRSFKSELVKLLRIAANNNHKTELRQFLSKVTNREAPLLPNQERSDLTNILDKALTSTPDHKASHRTVITDPTPDSLEQASFSFMNAITQKNYSGVEAALEKYDAKTINRLCFEGEIIALHYVLEVIKELRFVKLFVKHANKVDFNLLDKRGYAPLHIAARNGLTEVVELFIEKTAVNINKTMPDGSTALHIAAEMGNLEIVKLLIERGKQKGININAVNSQEQTPLYLAVLNERIEVVGFLLQQPEINGNYARRSDGITPLHMAVHKRNIIIIRLFAEKKNIDFNLRSKIGQTPFYVAIIENSIDIVRYLITLESRVDPNLYPAGGIHPLHISVHNECAEIIKLLAKASKFDSTIYDLSGDTPLHRAIKTNKPVAIKILIEECPYVALHMCSKENITPLHLAVIMGNKEAVALIFARTKKDVSFDVNVTMPEFGDTPLHIATEKGYIELVELFLGHKDIDINARLKNDDATPLHLAAQNGFTDIVRLFLAHKDIDINVRLKDRRTPLHLAARNGHAKTVQLLLTQGKSRKIDLNAINIQEETPLFLAAYYGHEEVVRLFLDEPTVNPCCYNITKTTPLHWAAKHGYLNIIKLFANKVGVNILDSKGATPLCLATEAGKTDIVKFLLTLSPKINLNSRFYNGMAVLHIAVYNGHRELVELFLQEEDIDINACLADGTTPFHIAAQEGYKEIIELLLTYKKIRGLKVNAVDNHGRTALHVAIENNHTSTVAVLVAAEVDLEVVDAMGRTPLCTAVYEGAPEIVELLIKHPLKKFSAVSDESHAFNVFHLAVFLQQINIIKILLDSGKFAVDAISHDMTSLSFLIIGNNNEELIRDAGIHIISSIEKQQEVALDAIRLLLKYGANPLIIVPAINKNLLDWISEQEKNPFNRAVMQMLTAAAEKEHMASTIPPIRREVRKPSKKRLSSSAKVQHALITAKGPASIRAWHILVKKHVKKNDALTPPRDEPKSNPRADRERLTYRYAASLGDDKQIPFSEGFLTHKRETKAEQQQIWDELESMNYYPLFDSEIEKNSGMPLLLHVTNEARTAAEQYDAWKAISTVLKNRLRFIGQGSSTPEGIKKFSDSDGWELVVKKKEGGNPRLYTFNTELTKLELRGRTYLVLTLDKCAKSHTALKKQLIAKPSVKR